MAPYQRMLCLPDPKKPPKRKRDTSQISSTKVKQPKAPRFKIIPTSRNGGVTTFRNTVQSVPTHESPSEPGLKIDGLRGDENSNSDEETGEEGGDIGAEEAREEAERLRGIVGIDMGTTYSAIAFVMADQDHTEIQVNKNWPGAAGGVLVKVETSYASTKTPGQTPNLKKLAWGYMMNSERKKHRSRRLLEYSWFKLLMGVDGEPARSELDDPRLKATMGKKTLHGVGYEQIARGWYKILYSKTMEMLTDRLTKGFVENMDLTWVISHPANYNEGQKSITLKAAEDAHKQSFSHRRRDKFRMVSEPEAAATITIAEILDLEKDRGSLGKGSTVMAVDFGGGTVDAKTFVINRTVPLRLTDACTGSAGWIGATSIYRAFLEMCEKEFGAAFTSLPPEKSAPGSEFYQNFEKVLWSFTGEDDDEDFAVQLMPMVQSFEACGCTSDKFDKSEGTIIITNNEMCQLFSCVIDGMMMIVDEQRVKLEATDCPPLTTIAAVGGLANCLFVFKTLKARCALIFQDSVQVCRPDGPWSAVARGAALDGLKPFMVQHRKSTHCLGVEVASAFDPTKDDIKDAYDDPKMGKRVGGYVKWLIQKGQRAKHEREISRFSAVVSLAASEESVLVKVRLYSYGGDDIPEKISHTGVRDIGELSFTCERLQKDQATKNLLGRPALCFVNVRARLSEDTGKMLFHVYKTGTSEILAEADTTYWTTAA